MKNFRKVLALILVVATLFSFVAMTSAREVGSYTDNDKISYTEAVDVLTALGILDGYTDGSFKPTDTIAREEMAKMVAVLSNAGDDVSSLYASACKFADTKDRWSASYVAYCNETGIVAGRNASTFDPRGKVTGIETAKMLLCLIGFDATAQGYVGTNWKVNVQRDAKNVGLLSGFAADYDMAKAITREEAAQMMLNALKAPMVVGTVSNNIVTVTNNVWVDLVGVSAVSLKGMTLTDAANKYGCWVLYGNVVVSDISVWKNYTGLDCTTDYTARDCYGNPGTKWTYKNSKGTVVFSKVYTTTPDFTYTTFASTLATDLKQEKANGYDYLMYVDGVKQGTQKWADLNDTAITAIKDETGNGVETKVYVNDVAKQVLVTVKNTYIGEVVSVSKHDNTFQLNSTAYAGVGSFSNKNYGFKVGDVVLFWICGGETVDANADGRLHAAKLATPVTDKVTETRTGGTSVNVTLANGKTYEYAKKFGSVIDTGLRQMNSTEVYESRNKGTKYDLYLDEFGYIMYWQKHVDAVETIYAYAVEGTEKAVLQNGTFTGDVYKYYVNMIDFEGNLKENVEINATAYERIKDRTNDQLKNKNGALVRYTVVDGVATMNDKYTWETDSSVSKWTGTLVDGVSCALDTNGNLVQNGTVVAYGTDSTLYMVRTRDYTNGGKYVYEVKTHDEMTTELKGYVNDGYNTFTTFASIQYFTEKVSTFTSDRLTYVFVDAMFSGAADLAYVSGDKVATISNVAFVNEIRDLELYPAFVNGEKAYLAFTKTNNQGQITDPVDPGLYRGDLQVIGLYYDKTPVYAEVTYENPTMDQNNHKVQYVDGHIFVKEASEAGYNITDDTYVVVTVCTGSGANCTATTYKLESVAEVNNFFEKYGNATQSPDGSVVYYSLDKTWLVDANGVVITDLTTTSGKTLSELYIVIGDTALTTH